MMNEKALLMICKKHNMKAFKVTSGLDEDTDIILDTEELEYLFEVCKCYDVKCLYYHFIMSSKEDFLLNRDKVQNHIDNMISELGNEYNSFTTYDTINIDVNAVMEKYDEEIVELINKQNAELNQISFDKPLIMDIFFSNHGDRIGVTLYNDDIDLQEEYLWHHGRLKEFERRIHKDILNQYETAREEMKRERELQIRQKEERRLEAISEITTILTDNPRLYLCTNGKLRHAYAKELAEEYSKKYECYVAIGDVDVLVDQEYRRIKAFMK